MSSCAVALAATVDWFVRPRVDGEINTPELRASTKLMVEAYMTHMVHMGAIHDYAVVCDETNNTSARIDANQLWIDLVIKENSSGEFVYAPVCIQ